jgi:similar to stage IV sporulation protein
MWEMTEPKSFKFKSGTITIKVLSMAPEKFINLLWKNNIDIKNIVRENITTFYLDVSLKNYIKINNIAKRTNSKIVITKRKGIAFLLLKAKNRITFVMGIILFVCILYFLSTFIWNIDITTEKYIAPYEILEQLSAMGIKKGINSRFINVYETEKKMIKQNDNIMWVSVRINGSNLLVNVIERQSPPKISSDTSFCNLKSKCDAQIERIYTTAGTAIVKPNDIVKKGQILIKGEQGKEGSIYSVHASGEVIAKTNYEERGTVQVSGTKNIRTGSVITNQFIYLFGKRFYLNKNTIKFTKYDKIVDSKSFIKKEIYYETKNVSFTLDKNTAVTETANKLYTKIKLNLDKTVKILDKIVDYKVENNCLNVRVLVVAEENIATEDTTS